MTVADSARAFFGGLIRNADAARHLEPYPDLAVHLLLPSERVVVPLRDGGATTTGEEPVGLWDLELEAGEDVFAAIFGGRRTLGESIYAGQLFVPEEKSKHNLVAALGQAIRIAQSQGQGVARHGDH
jgi:hypothetical protein